MEMMYYILRILVRVVEISLMLSLHTPFQPTPLVDLTAQAMLLPVSRL